MVVHAQFSLGGSGDKVSLLIHNHLIKTGSLIDLIISYYGYETLSHTDEHLVAYLF